MVSWGISILSDLIFNYLNNYCHLFKCTATAEFIFTIKLIHWLKVDSQLNYQKCNYKYIYIQTCGIRIQET